MTSIVRSVGVLRRRQMPRGAVPRLSSAAPSSLCRVRAEDRDLVAQGIAEISDIEVIAVLGPEAGSALVGAARLKTSGVKVTDHLMRLGLEGRHRAVANGRLLPVVWLPHVYRGGAAGPAGHVRKGEFDAVRHFLLPVTERGQDGRVETPRERDIVGTNPDVAQHAVAPVCNVPPEGSKRASVSGNCTYQNLDGHSCTPTEAARRV